MLNIGVYSKDNFLFKELEDKLNDSNILLTHITEADEIQFQIEFDLFIVLSDFDEKIAKFIKEYSKKIIDLTGLVKHYNINVDEIIEPSVYLLEKYFGYNISDIKGNIYYPVIIFGKAGIDDLINQTRDIFTFNSSEYKVLDIKLPFNAAIGLGYESKGIKEYISRFDEDIVNNFDLRLIPFSTYMIIDIFKPTNIEIYCEYLENKDSISNILSDVSHKITAFDDERVSIFADYLKVIIEQIIEKINQYIGV